MLIATSTAEAMQNQRLVHVNGHDYTLSAYVGAAPLRGKYVEGNERNDNGLPQGFLVWQPPGSVTLPHFHETNQFQVFVEGIGSMGKHAAQPLTVQYANGHTPYGPIIASETGVHYFTLRQRWDPGAKYMPGARDKLTKGNQRTRIKGAIPTTTEAERDGIRTPRFDEVFAPEDDGMAAWLCRFGREQSCEIPDVSGTGGQYLVVADGELMHDGKLYEKWSTLFLTPDEPTPAFVSTSSGLDLLILQFPAQHGPDKGTVE